MKRLAMCLTIACLLAAWPAGVRAEEQTEPSTEVVEIVETEAAEPETVETEVTEPETETEAEEPAETVEAEAVETDADMEILQEEALEAVAAAAEKCGLTEESDGSLVFYKEDGSLLKSSMKKVDGSYYYFTSTGKALKSGFTTFRGAKYYFDADGKRVENTTMVINGAAYSFRADGKVVTDAWKKDGEKTYYFGSTGKASTGLKKMNNKLYDFSSKGVLQTGLKKVDSDNYYFSPEGALGMDLGSAETGWVTYSGYCYYFGSDFKALKNGTKNAYVLDDEGRSKTRYLVCEIVDEKTNETMTKDQKIKALWDWLVNNSWTYTRTYEHTASDWEWYKGWTDDFAKQLIMNQSGNCFRYAAGFGYMVYEATGYEVRVYHGMTPAARGGVTPHGWITVNIDGTWYAYDPDLYKFGHQLDRNYKKPYSETSKSFHLQGSYNTIK